MAQNKYKYQLANGKHLVVEGETEPSDEDLESIAQEQGVELQLAGKPPTSPDIPPIRPSASISNVPIGNESIGESADFSNVTGGSSTFQPSTYESDYIAKYGQPPLLGPETERKLSTPLLPDYEHEPDTWLGGFGKGLYEEFAQPLSSPRALLQELLTGGTVNKLAKGGLKVADNIVAPPVKRHYTAQEFLEFQKARLDPNFKSTTINLPKNTVYERLGTQDSLPEPRFTSEIDKYNALKLQEEMDPNFMSGVGDAELAGSTPYQPTPSFKEGPSKTRLYELIDKDKSGTLTANELVEARSLDKQLREGRYKPEFNRQGFLSEIGAIGKNINENRPPLPTPDIPETGLARVGNQMLEPVPPVLTPEILTPDQYTRFGVDVESGSQFGNTKQVESTRGTYNNFDAEAVATRRGLWGNMSQEEINRWIELDSSMKGSLSKITPEMHDEFVSLRDKRPGPKQPDQYLLKQQAEQTRLQNVADNKKLYGPKQKLLTGETTSSIGTPKEYKDYDKLWNNSDNIDFQGAVRRTRKIIKNELDPEAIRRNFDEWDTELQERKLSGNADDIETAGSLRDEAIDKLNKLDRPRRSLFNDETGAIGNDLGPPRKVGDSDLFKKPTLPEGPQGEGGRMVLNRAGRDVLRPLKGNGELFDSPEILNEFIKKEPEFADRLLSQTTKSIANELRSTAEWAEKTSWSPNVPGQADGAIATANHLKSLADEVENSPDKAGIIFRIKQLFSDERGMVGKNIGSPTSTVTPSTSQSLKPGTVVVIKANKASAAAVKKAREAGFEYDGLNDQGDFRFKKTAIGAGPSQPVLESEVGQSRPTSAGARQQLGALSDVKKSSTAAEIFSLPRALMASWDASAPLRQGIGLIHKPAFWKSLGPMMKAWGSEDAFQAAQKAISEKPLFKSRVGKINPKTGQPTILPSFAEDAGLKLTDLMTKREENIMSTWAEKVPGVRPSNRAYTIFLNKLRADTFEDLIKNGKIFGADGTANIPLARALAEFVNTASGRGHLGKNLERSAVVLNNFMFSPRLMASRLKMMDPRLYLMGPPQVRKEALKSLLAITAVGNSVTQLVKLAGGTVGNDPASSDFGKAKIGDTRIDPYAGFQQYIVAANRLLRPTDFRIPGAEKTNTGIVPIDNMMGMLSGKGQEVHSTTNSNKYNLWNAKGPYDPTWGSVAGRFARGKANPVVGFAISLVSGKKEMTGKPMDFTNLNPFENSIAQRFIPIIMQDLYELSQTDEIPPEIKALVGAGAALGMGTQTYD